ncbi:MAG: pseudouridine synthase [Patescibacteria group bacterium]|nr:pseudouridine synthase [Patescibacteria group bacterium]
MERLNKYIARCGVCSRREADDLIEAGKIKVNGKITSTLGIKIDPDNDTVQLKGKTIEPDKKLLFAFYKPKGVTSTLRDYHARKTITDYFKGIDRVYPVGRLDKESEGLMIVTNDGDLANELMHPKYNHEKEYEVLLSGYSDRNLSKFQEKYEVGGKTIQPMEYKILETFSGNNWLVSLILREGKKRQIREVADYLGYKIKKLKRVRIDDLKLSDLNLSPGQFKPIDSKIFHK